MMEVSPGEHQNSAARHDEAGLFRALITGDDENDRRLTISHLGKAWPAGRELMLDCAGDGTEALKKIRANRYGLIVLGWNMPHPNGENLLLAIRREGLRVPVVVVSGQRRVNIESYLDSMAAGFVNKKEMTAVSFRNAIVTSILLQDGVFGLVRSGHDASLNGWPKIKMQFPRPRP